MLLKLRAALAVLVLVLVLYGATITLLGTVPQEDQLTSVSGTLADVRTSYSDRTREPSFEFSVNPDGGQPVRLNMPSFGKAHVVAALESAQGRAVKVRYRSLLLGNRAYEVVQENTAIVSFGEAQKYVSQKNAEGQSWAWPALALYGGVPLLFAGIAVWRRRSKTPADPQSAFKLARAAAAIGLPLLGTGALAYDFFTKPQSLTPMTGVFGADPLGLPGPVFATLLVATGLAPLGFMAWHLVSMNHYIAATGGKTAAGILGMLIALGRNWGDQKVRHHGRLMIAGLLGFFIVMGLWIMATERAGV